MTCDPNASCVNTVRDLAGVGLAAAYSCVCNDGFVGDGLTCIATGEEKGFRIGESSRTQGVACVVAWKGAALEG